MDPQLRAELGLSSGELKKLQKALADASAGIGPGVKGKNRRRQATARRLSITVPELVAIRRVLGGGAPTTDHPTARRAARQVLGVAGSLKATAKATQASAAVKNPRTSPATWPRPNQVVYVAPQGDAVHLDRDCPGFEPFGSNPRVDRLELRDRRCGGRLPCRKCVDTLNSSRYRAMLSVLKDLHGTTAESATAAGRRRKKQRSSSSKRKKSVVRGANSANRQRREYWVWANREKL